MSRENQKLPNLFTPFSLRGLTFKNRIAVSPMCQYSCEDGFATDWHVVHLGSRAVGGAALVMVEATGVDARGRISAADMGLWKDEQIEPLARVASYLKRNGAVPGIQLAHAGRKASTRVPWEGGSAVRPEEGGWTPVAPSPVPFREGDPIPHELTRQEIDEIVQAFANSTRRAIQAGFQVVEIHGAHGYLIHEFCSPLSNFRTDEYGGGFENRTRFLVEAARAVRSTWPENLPVFARLSCTDWVDSGGWDIDQTVEAAKCLRDIGIDLIDCSSGGAVPGVRIPVGPAYQTPFAEQVRKDAGIPTGAVGLITEAKQAESIIEGGRADMVLLARAMLRDPYWALHAAVELGLTPEPPIQYGRAF